MRNLPPLQPPSYFPLSANWRTYCYSHRHDRDDQSRAGAEPDECKNRPQSVRAGAPQPRVFVMRFIPSAEMVEAIRLVTGVDPFDDPDIIRKALRDPATAPKIEALYERLKAGQPA